MAKKENPSLEVAEITLLRCMHGDHFCPYCSKRVSTDCNLPDQCGHCGYPLKTNNLSKISVDEK